MIDNDKLLFKVLVVGDKNVGKTSLIERLVFDRFIQKPYEGMSYYRTFEFSVSGVDSPVILQFWDANANPQFKSTIPYYVAGASGVIIVIESTNQKELEINETWLEILEKYIEKKIPKLVIGTKSDSQTIDTSRLSQFMEKFAINEFYLTSAKTGKNVKESFQKMAQMIILENK